jgi:thiol-disulfide isomerase/thioredoxin
MGVRRSRRYLLVAAAASLWCGMIASGCSRNEGTNPDAEASPFDLKPAGKFGAKNSAPGGLELPLPGESAASRGTSDDPLKGLELPGKSALDTRFGANDVEKAIREAMRALRNGDQQTAAELLDQVLSVDSVNREALLARGVIAFEDWRKGKSPEGRTAAIEKAVALARRLQAAFDSPQGNETAFVTGALYGYAQHLAQAGRFDDAIKALDESAATGFEPYFAVEKDEKMAELRKSPQFVAARNAHDVAILKAARERVKEKLAKPVDLKFQFTHRDLDSKPISLSDFKGKVVLVDFWGTWCGPCREAIPFLIELYRHRKDKGLQIVGLDYEKDIPDESKARETVKAFAKQVGMTYPCLIGAEPTIKQIPGFKGFPTVVVVDRAGKVRLVITETDDNTMNLVRDVVEVLLEEPVPPAEPAKKPAGEPKKAGA